MWWWTRAGAGRCASRCAAGRSSRLCWPWRWPRAPGGSQGGLGPWGDCWLAGVRVVGVTAGVRPGAHRPSCDLVARRSRWAGGARYAKNPHVTGAVNGADVQWGPPGPTSRLPCSGRQASARLGAMGLHGAGGVVVIHSQIRTRGRQTGSLEIVATQGFRPARCCPRVKRASVTQIIAQPH